MPVMSDSAKQNNGKGWKIATIITSVAAVCGIGFGVYELTQNSAKDEQISDLKVQVKNNDGTVATIETPQIETTAGGRTTETVADSAAKENSEDYIYVGEWGFKVRKSENWRDLISRYVYHNDYPQATDTFEIVEDESIATSHALISLYSENYIGNDDKNMYHIQIDGASRISILVPDSVSAEFKSWVTDSSNYSAI